jgi:hypothetical protein
MKKLQTLTVAAGILLALAGTSVAAQRVHRAYDAYASGADRSGAYYYGPQGEQAYGAQVQTPAQYQYNSAPNYGQNLPYPDRPYGAPDRW